MAFREGFEPPTDGLEGRSNNAMEVDICQKTALNNKELAIRFLDDLPLKYKQLPHARLKKLLMYAESYLHNLDKLNERNKHERKQ